MNTVFKIFSAFFILTFIGNAALAGESACTTSEREDGAIHCASPTGLSSEANDGRYIKLEVKGQSAVICMSEDSAASVLNDEAKNFLGKNTIIYSICQDAAGKDCSVIAKDNFEVTQNGDTFTASPETFIFDLANVAGDYTKCDPRMTYL